MADLPTVFSESAATRIGAATRWAELQQGIPQDGYGSSPGNGICLVRTGTTLPAGYTGSMAVLGDVVEKKPDGTVIALGKVWIKDINSGTLSANTIYQARVGGTYTQDITVNGIVTPTTLGLYLVQLPVVAPDDHFRPASWFYELSWQFNYNGLTYQHIGNNYVILLPYYQNKMSDFATYNRTNQIRVAYRKTKTTFEYNKTIYTLVEWYSTDAFLIEPVKIWYNNAMKQDGSFFNVSVINPAVYLSYYSPFSKAATGYFSCIYRINSYNNSTQFMDQLVAVAKLDDIPTTSGISTGIGSGISGV